MGFAYPVMLEVAGRRCVVIGSGAVAESKAQDLTAAGATVEVIASEPSPGLVELEARGLVELVRRDFADGDLAGAFVAIADVQDSQLVGRIFAEAERLGVLLNSVDDVPHCHFSAPSKVRRGDLLVTISTGGKAPALAKQLRRKVESEITEEYGALVDLLGEARRAALPARESMSFDQWATRWELALEADLLSMVRRGQTDEAREHVVRTLTDPESRERAPSAGKVWIVGAGPGASDLITVRGREVLERADVVVYDRLVDPELVEGKEAIYAGKSPGSHSAAQKEINDLLIELARAGKQVARLKGGDPFVFGRGAEEVEALAAAGVDFSVIPGLTSAIAVLEAAGIPVTDRRLASSMAVATGHCGGRRAVDFRAMAGVVDTIVVLMGMSNLEHITKELMAGGLAESTPAAIVNEGTMPTQRVLVGELGRLSAEADAAGLGSPSVVVVGNVVNLRQRIQSP
ncbi:MAG: siroheme synthase CysG [Actinobacteria bacterium]|nr:siroheme synthase CysG [Actinomycetota bacterium]